MLTTHATIYLQMVPISLELSDRIFGFVNFALCERTLSIQCGLQCIVRLSHETKARDKWMWVRSAGEKSYITQTFFFSSHSSVSRTIFSFSGCSSCIKAETRSRAAATARVKCVTKRDISITDDASLSGFTSSGSPLISLPPPPPAGMYNVGYCAFNFSSVDSKSFRSIWNQNANETPKKKKKEMQLRSIAVDARPPRVPTLLRAVSCTPNSLPSACWRTASDRCHAKTFRRCAAAAQTASAQYSRPALESISSNRPIARRPYPWYGPRWLLAAEMATNCLSRVRLRDSRWSVSFLGPLYRCDSANWPNTANWWHVRWLHLRRFAIPISWPQSLSAISLRPWIEAPVIHTIRIN